MHPLPSGGVDGDAPARDPLDVSGKSGDESSPGGSHGRRASSIFDEGGGEDAAAAGDDDGGVDFPASPMLRRYPSFIPLRRHATSIAEVAFLVPSSGSSRRKASIAAATFNMTATIVGGGVLSIPLSCARAGVLPFTVLMIASAAATDFSLYVLVSSSRRCGSTSFGHVARSAYGPALEVASTLLIFLIVGCLVVGLMILNRGIWTPIVVAGLSSLLGSDDREGGGGGAGRGTTTQLQDAAVLLALLLTMTPFLLKKDLTSLRHICYVGFFSIATLCAAMVYRAADRNLREPGLFESSVKWTSASLADTLNALPIILLAFICSYNMISVSCALVNPTRERVKTVIHKGVGSSFLLMYIFGLAGYLYAYDETNGNVLLNFDPTDRVILTGRVGCGIMTLFALPINTLPCREALLSLVAQISEIRARSLLAANPRNANAEQRRLVERRSAGEGSTNMDGAGVAKLLRTTGADREDRFNKSEPGYGTAGKESPRGEVKSIFDAEEAIHCATTFGIVAVCYVVAVTTPGVAIIWDIAGSSMAFVIQFIVPSACYIRLKLRTSYHNSSHLVMAWFLFVSATVMAILCTAQTALRLSGKLQP